MGQLVIGRQVSQALVFKFPNGTTGRIEYTEQRGANIRLAIEFPESVKIVREELLPVHERKLKPSSNDKW